MDLLQHSPISGPMSEVELMQAAHQNRLAVAGAKIDRDFQQISEFQRYIKTELDMGRGPKTVRPEVEALAATIDREAFVRMYADQGLAQIPAVHRHFPTTDEMLAAINFVTHLAPIYRDVNSISWQFPLSSLMNFWMMTPAGKQLMRLPQFNADMNAIMKAWCEYLDTKESRYVLNDGPTGWFNEAAWKYNQLDDYIIPNPKGKYLGFSSYNDFFHRMIKPEKRPVDHPDDNRYINSPNDGVAWALEEFVQRDDAFWLKSQAYSMGNLLNQSPLVDSFVGGTVYQTYVNGGADWHGFSAPINGKLASDPELVEGYAWTESDVVGPDPMSGPYSQGWAAGVATRGLIFIDSGDPVLGIVCVVPIGLTEVSSLKFAPELKKGRVINKGDVLGNFSFGGSSFAVVFQPGAIQEILVKPPLTGRNEQPVDTLKANKTCAIANLAADKA